MASVQTIRVDTRTLPGGDRDARAATDEEALLQFILDQPLYKHEKPYELVFDVSDIPADKRPAQTNLAGSIDFPPTVIRDLRHIPRSFTLKNNGFQVVNASWLEGCQGGHDPVVDTKVSPFSQEWIESVYYPEVERIIRMAVKDVIEVYFFDWRVRSSNDDKNGFKTGEYGDLRDRTNFQGPSGMVHVGMTVFFDGVNGIDIVPLTDNTDHGAERRVWRHYEEEKAESLLKEHFQQINVWRPFSSYPVPEYPLAVCDGSTVDIEEDLHRADLVSRTHVGESWYPKYKDHYDWYYLNEQTRDEVMLLKMWDNDPNARAKCFEPVRGRKAQRKH